MADRDAIRTPVIDIVQRGDDVLIRTEADLRPEDVQVVVEDGTLEVRVPRSALKPRTTRLPQGAAGLTGGRQARPAPEEPPSERSHKPGTAGAEPPLSLREEQDLWNAQKPLISEDRVTSIHLEGFTDEQANEVLEVLGDDASEEAQGGSATGSGIYPAHGGFPSRRREEEEPS